MSRSNSIPASDRGVPPDQPAVLPGAIHPDLKQKAFEAKDILLQTRGALPRIIGSTLYARQSDTHVSVRDVVSAGEMGHGVLVDGDLFYIQPGARNDIFDQSKVTDIEQLWADDPILRSRRIPVLKQIEGLLTGLVELAEGVEARK